MAIEFDDEKLKYVQRAPHTRDDHKCHWPSCPKMVKPAYWGCYAHWMKLPKRIRDDIWSHFVPGQEEGKARVTAEYVVAATRAQDWIKEKFPNG